MSYAVSFAIPFESLFNDSFFSGREGGDFSEAFNKLLVKTKVTINSKWLEEKHDSRDIGKGDVYVFYSPEKENFIMLDLYSGRTDQSNMIGIGAHANTLNEADLRELMLNIYNDKYSDPKSKFVEHRRGELLNQIDSAQFPKYAEGYMQKIHFMVGNNSCENTNCLGEY